MIYVGIDVAKDKHDCCILSSDGEILFSPFTIPNNLSGYDELYEKIWSLSQAHGSNPSSLKYYSFSS